MMMMADKAIRSSFAKSRSSAYQEALREKQREKEMLIDVSDSSTEQAERAGKAARGGSTIAHQVVETQQKGKKEITLIGSTYISLDLIVKQIESQSQMVQKQRKVESSQVNLAAMNMFVGYQNEHVQVKIDETKATVKLLTLKANYEL